MIGQLIFGHAIHRPLRTFVSVAAVAVEVMLVLIIVGLTGGMVEEVGKRIEGVGADIMVQPPNASRFLAFSGAPMTVKIGEKARHAQICTGCGAGFAPFQFLRRRGHYLRN